MRLQAASALRLGFIPEFLPARSFERGPDPKISYPWPEHDYKKNKKNKNKKIKKIKKNKIKKSSFSGVFLRFREDFQ